MKIMAFVNNHTTINGLILIFACLAYANDKVFSVVSDDGGNTLTVVRGQRHVKISPIYASAQLTGDIQQTG